MSEGFVMNLFAEIRKLAFFTVLAGLAVSSAIRLPIQAVRPAGSTNNALPPQLWQRSPEAGQALSGATVPSRTVTANYYLFLPTIDKPSDVSWPMVGANPQRTSWTSEQVPSTDYLISHPSGMLYPQWAKPIAAYIPQKVQVIAANNSLYISTARGLYALDPANGSVKWIFPTDLPLGHSPTIANGVAYVGGLDHRLYAIDATTGVLLWSYDNAGAGFDTNPLVVNQIVYAGNRDGYMYAVYANEHPQHGQLAWRYKTDGPIHFSAAFDGTNIDFASDDSYAYALNALTGELVWKSAKLPGAGFHSWWPVVYNNVVIFAGSSNYRDHIRPGTLPLPLNVGVLDREVLQGDDPNDSAYAGQPLGPRGADGWIDTSRSVSIAGLTANIATYYESKPLRRTYLVLDKNTGREVTFAFTGNGKADYAPFLWYGTHSGNRYPPIVGPDGILYQAATMYYSPWISRGTLLGWRYGTPFVSTPSGYSQAIDEPIAYAAGGNFVYWNVSGDQRAGALNLSAPTGAAHDWMYWGNGLDDILPNYNVAFGGDFFGGQNGSYQNNGDQNPPIPYQGRVYLHRSNAVIALAPQRVTPVVLATAPVITAPASTVPSDLNNLKQRLAQEVQKIVDTGHLRPGFHSSGLIDLQLDRLCADRFQDYFENPADTLYTLVRALPYLPSDLSQRTRTYLQAEFAAYSPLSVNHVGWKDGNNRQAFDVPPEVAADMANLPARQYDLGFLGWPGESTPPFTFYAMWKYAQAFGGAQQLFAQAKGNLPSVPSDDVLAQFPFAHNAFIAGYIGYIGLATMAGDTAEASSKQATLNTLLAKRAANFSKDTTYTETDSNHQPGIYCRALSNSRNFTYLVPELGDYLHSNALTKVQVAVDEYNRIAPYWFVSWFEDTVGEAVFQPLYDTRGIFAAKSMILKQPREELVKYLDVPGFARGDLFYLQNLIDTIEAPSSQ